MERQKVRRANKSETKIEHEQNPPKAITEVKEEVVKNDKQKESAIKKPKEEKESKSEDLPKKTEKPKATRRVVEKE